MKPDIDSRVREQRYHKTDSYIIHMNPGSPEN